MQDQDRHDVRRMVWLAAGLVAGLAIASVWPHEPAYAVTTDRDAKFAMTTCTVSVVAVDPIEAIFVLDFLTGSLKGAVLNRQIGKFTAFYYRNLALDFKVDPKSEPHYVIVNGQAQLSGNAGLQFASSVLYIGELTSGKIVCYGFPWKESRTPLAPFQLVQVDGFQFREPSQ